MISKLVLIFGFCGFDHEGPGNREGHGGCVEAKVH